MTSLTVNGSAAAATTLVTAGKLFAATGGTSGNTSTKVGTSTQFKQVFAKGTTTNQTGVASIPAPTDSNFSGWLWDVTTLEGQRLAAGTWTPTIHLLASTGTTVTPTVQWFRRSSGGVYTQIGSVAGSSIALTTSSQLLVFTAPSLSLMDFATGDKLCCWLWVNQTAGGATNSTISVVEDTGGTAGVASEAQTATPGYAPIPVSLAATCAGVGTLIPTLSAQVALSVTLVGAGTDVLDPYGAELYGVRLYGTETLVTTTALSATLAGTGVLSGTMSTSGGAVALSSTLAGVGTLAGTLSANLSLPTVTFAAASTLGGGLGVGSPFTLYGSAVASGTLTTASQMSTTTGGTEVSKTTTLTGPTTGYTYGEVTSLGISVSVVTAIPATPTGNGWIFYPGAGTFADGNWSAEASVSTTFTGGAGHSDYTLRFFKYSGGSFTLIGSINVAASVAAKTLYSFAATAMGATTFGATDGVYIDLWWHDSNSYASGDNPVVYVSSSATVGVASDMQITTAAYTPAGAVLAATCAGAGTLTMGAASLSTALTGTCAGVGTLTPTLIATLALPSETMTGVGQLSGTVSLTTALSTTMAGAGTCAATLSTAGGPVALSSTLAGAGALAATFTLTTSLTDTLAGVGTLSGAFSLQTVLGATCAGVGTLAPVLSAALALPTTTSAGVGTLTGTMSEVTALAVTCAGVGTLSGTTSEKTALAVTIPGVATFTAALSGAGVFTATMNGTGTLTGTMTLATSLTASIAGSGQLSPTMGAQFALSGQIAGESTLSGTIAAATALTTALAGTGTLAGVFSLSTALGATSAAAGALSGTLSAQTALFLTCAGAGTLTGALAILGGISVTCSGTSTCAGALSFPGPSATATWKTRDMRATWVTRDDQATWVTRDDKTTWNTRR